MGIPRWLRGQRVVDPYRAVEQALDRIAELDATRSRDPEANRPVQRRVAEELPPIREHLRTHSGDLDRVHADIHARGLATRFPWRRLNDGTARDLAVLYFFTPYQDTSALVAARRLWTRGLVTDVISQAVDDTRRIDKSSDRVAREFLDRTTVLPGESGFAEWSTVRRFTEGVLAEVAALEAEKGPYRTLYTRAMAPHSHFAGALLKVRNPDLRWTAEFSDPLLINAYGEARVSDVEDDWLSDELLGAVVAAGFEAPTTRAMFSLAELIPYALADEIIFTNDHQRRFMFDRCEHRALADRAASVAGVQHQPTLPASFYELSSTIYPLADGVVHLGYFGLFFGTRGLDELVDAFAALTPDEKARIHLHVFTDKPGRMKPEVERRGLLEVISVRSYVPFLKFLNLTTRFDVLLVNDAVTDHFELNPYLPSKVSDYLGSGTPIWGIYEPGSVLSSLDTAYATEIGDVGAATVVLRKLIESGPGSRRSDG